MSAVKNGTYHRGSRRMYGYRQEHHAGSWWNGGKLPVLKVGRKTIIAGYL